MGLPVIRRDREYTYGEYKTWPEEERWELIDGAAWDMSAAPNRRHQRFSIKLGALLDAFFDQRGCQVYAAPFDVLLPGHTDQEMDTINTIVQPDISVICDSRKLIDQGCMGPPDLVVEILSPATSKKDLNEKFDLYQRVGVREYWIVDPGNRYIRVFVLQPSGEYDSGEIYEYDTVAVSRVFEGLRVDLPALFAAAE